MEVKNSTPDQKNNLAYDFFSHACRSADRTAVWVNGQLWSYKELSVHVSRLAGWLRSRFPGGGKNIGILANRSAETYIGLLAALWSGNTYVPLNNKLPAPYLKSLMLQADVDNLVVDRQTLAILTDPCFKENHTLTVISPLELLKAPVELNLVSPHKIKSVRTLSEPVAVSAEQTAYIIFTSGSTGAPKGIAPNVANVAWFLEATQERYQLQPDDRISQANDLYWDPSVFDLFSSWKVGAATYVVPDRQLVAPLHFIREHALTVWYSGPVQINFLNKMHLLKTGVFPSLRLSLFVGEPLLKEAADSWQKAACNSLIENVYGPTETTVVCTGQPFSDDPACMTPERGYLAIGTPYRGAQIRILDEQQRTLPDGQIGEIAIGGPMVTPGYWKAPELTTGSFVSLPGSKEQWYLTGDLGYRTTQGVFHFVGRRDNQLQVQGLRIEPEEIEYHLRKITGSDEVAVIGWPAENLLITGLTAFISTPKMDLDNIRRQLRRTLPAVMIPNRIEVLIQLPRNQNHKIDRKALLQLLKEKGETA